MVVVNRSLTDQQVKDMKIKMLPGYSDPHGKRYEIIFWKKGNKWANWNLCFYLIANVASTEQPFFRLETQRTENFVFPEAKSTETLRLQRNQNIVPSDHHFS